MSRIDELLTDLCPEGVEFKTLGEVIRLKNGKDHKAIGDGQVPVYGSGGVIRHVDTAMADGPCVLIPRKGSLGNVTYVEGPFWHVDTIFRTELDSSSIEPRYLYHQLLAMRLGELNQAGGVPSQTQAGLNALRIPLPPLEVQGEIVRVLDQFSQLEAELEAELEARRRQYAHYREELVGVPSSARYPLLLLGELGAFTRGRRFTKADMADFGTPCLHYGEIYTGYGVSARHALSHVRPNFEQTLRFARPGDVVLAGVGETVSDVGIGVAWLGEGPIAIHDDCFAFSSELNPAFVAHVTRTQAFNDQKTPHVSRGKVKRLGRDGLAKIRIPVPSPQEQMRIVSMLDDFEALVNDLSVGLPAELAARRKQYEYYRDKLLTFEERRP